MKTATQPSTAQPQVPRHPAGVQPALNSTTLLGMKGEVEIAHQGDTYRLRLTRQGKLILTK